MAHLEEPQSNPTPAPQSREGAEPPAVRAEGVCKTYRARGLAVTALEEIDLTVAHGELLAIMGPSGSGKTTLLNCLAGLDTVDCGRVEVAGVDLAKLSDAARADFRARTMGFVFQNFNLLPVLNAVENVELPLLLLGAPAHTARERARKMLATVGLERRERHRPAELSGGQRQRVAIARALINDPAIIWADEPTGNLDSEAAEEILAIFRDLNRTRGQTFVIVTHSHEIGAQAHRVIHMRDGRIE
jgi:putative ABC transport system ATP-binding protein